MENDALKGPATRYDVIEPISSYECPRMRTSCRAPRTRRHTLRVSRGKSRDVMTNVKAVRLFIIIIIIITLFRH